LDRVPDLIVHRHSSTLASITAGGSITAAGTVKNQGTAVAAASSLKYYLSADNAYSAGDTYLATSSVASLAANGTAAVSSQVNIPSATAAGTWYVLFFADADLQVAESSETNNVGSVAITVTATVQGCNSTTRYPSTTLSPTTNWKSQKSIYAGEYAVFNVVSGRVYTFSYCSTDAASASYNSALTLRNFSTDAFIAFSDDACGDDAKIIWTATYTGTVKLVTSTSGCGTNSISSTLRYKYSAAKEAEGKDVSQPDYLVYPNPTHGQISVEASSGFENVKQITIYNASGKVVQSVEIPEKSDNIYNFNLSDCASGMYLVKVIGVEKTEQFKVVLKK